MSHPGIAAMEEVLMKCSPAERADAVARMREWLSKEDSPDSPPSQGGYGAGGSPWWAVKSSEGRMFWQHKETKKKTWTRPADAPETPGQSGDPADWRCFVSDKEGKKGRKWWYNTRTKEKVWQCPPGVKDAGTDWRETSGMEPVSFDQACFGMIVHMKLRGQGDNVYTGKIVDIDMGKGEIKMRWHPPSGGWQPTAKHFGPPADTETKDSLRKDWWDTKGGAEAYRYTQRLTSRQYIEELQAKRDDVNTDQLEDLLGRLCYGNQPGAFTKLSNPFVRTCFVMGGDGLQLLLACEADPTSDNVDMLLKIGYDVLMIYQNARWGTVTNLVVFSKESMGEDRYQPATWAGAGRLISDPSCFPAAAPIVQKHAEELSQSGSEPINVRAYKALEAEYQGLKPKDGEYEHTTPLNAQGKKNRQYEHPETKKKSSAKFRFDDDDYRYGAMMTEKALAALGEKARPCHSRAFLMHCCGMNPLFGGDGIALAEGKVRVLLFDDPEEQVMWQQIKQNLVWPPDADKEGPRLTCDIIDERFNKVVAFKHDRLVRVSDMSRIGEEAVARWRSEKDEKDEPERDIYKVRSEKDLPEAAWDAVLLEDGVLHEYIALNLVQADIPDLVSAPIGTPSLEKCVQKIAYLLNVLLQQKYRVKVKNYQTPHNWVEYTDDEPVPVKTKKDKRSINGETGCIDGSDSFKHSRYVGLTMEEFAKRYTQKDDYEDEHQDKHRVVKKGQRLGGVGFRIRCLGDAVQSSQFARGTLDRGLKVSGPAMLQQLPRNCLDSLLIEGFKPFEIYGFLMNSQGGIGDGFGTGMGFTLDVFPWELWREGDEPGSRRQFPTTEKGIGAFIESHFPEALDAYNKHSCNICKEPPSDEMIRQMQSEQGKDIKPMTYERFKGLPKGGGGPTELDVRHFLYSTLSLGPDWQGNAVSHGLDPQDRNFQYLMCNDKLSRMRREGRVLTIPLGAPSPDMVVEKLQSEYKRMREHIMDDASPSSPRESPSGSPKSR